ncbi:MAG: glycoside hydrolase family 127 protein, partial [Oscillospiraceae bacterium]|nr:glycoside hydrolase family 127 protein [Oscillospiraceae bacterium]
LVYCFEEADNGDVLSLSLKRGGDITVGEHTETPFGEVSHGTVKITADAVRRDDIDALYTNSIPNETSCKAVGIPYYTWGNRGENQMRIWLPESLV